MKAVYDDGTILFIGEEFATHEILINKLTIFGKEGTVDIGKVYNIPKEYIGKSCILKLEVMEK